MTEVRACRSTSLLSQDGVEHPAAARVRPLAAKVCQGFDVGTAALFEAVCQDRQVLEEVFLLDRAGESGGGLGRVTRRGSGRRPVAEGA
jgi:hypothetical protein